MQRVLRKTTDLDDSSDSYTSGLSKSLISIDAQYNLYVDAVYEPIISQNNAKYVENMTWMQNTNVPTHISN